MPSPELFRALGALCGPREPAHARLAAVIGLPPPADAAAFTEECVFQLMPYAAPSLSPDGMLGREAGDRVVGFWLALHLSPPPAEPDHLACLLGLYAALSEREQGGPGSPEVWREARADVGAPADLGALVCGRHDITPFRAGFHAAWARRLARALLHEAQAPSPPSVMPLHLPDVPRLPDAGAVWSALLVPAPCGPSSPAATWPALPPHRLGRPPREPHLRVAVTHRA